MKTIAAVALMTSLLLPGFVAEAGETEDIGKAQEAAKAWLALTDAGQYGQSWEEAASLFKLAITRPDWEKAIRSARAPLGAVKSRQVKSATFKGSLPGAPDGQYVIIQYDSQFANKAAAIETITPMLDKDGHWRVSGYFIR
jgi:Protein of unknown function (DUF4019)